MLTIKETWPRPIQELSLAAHLLSACRDLRTRAVAEEASGTWYQGGPHAAFDHIGQALQVFDGNDLSLMAREMLAARSASLIFSQAYLEEAESMAKATLLSRIMPAPKNADFVERLRALRDLPWLNGWALEIPRGWVPIIERAAALLQDPYVEDDRSSWMTDDLKEKYGTLRWDVLGSDLFRQVAWLAEEMSEYTCMVCGRGGAIHDQDGILLTLCEDHIISRTRSPSPVSRFMYADPSEMEQATPLPQPQWPLEFHEIKLAGALWVACRHLRFENKRTPVANWYEAEDAAHLDQVAVALDALEGGHLADLARSLLPVRRKGIKIHGQLLDAAEQAAREAIFARLSKAPTTRADLNDRIRALKDVPWIGSWASDLARGWVPLVEKMHEYLVSITTPEERENWKTLQIKEKFGSLRWYVSGNEALQDASDLAENLSQFLCIACGESADFDTSSRYVLVLCPQHARIRQRSPDALHLMIFS